MKVKTITYKKIHNLGNYSSKHLEMFAELNEEDNEIECARHLRNKVWRILEKPVEIANLDKKYPKYIRYEASGEDGDTEPNPSWDNSDMDEIPY
ncbi:MAG TPA: hypothetical protein DD379_09675 [Cyanobacteria bacterium UBA11162]|nr:hypothetical protein [Cyanobacteria bacterium UBA11162]